MEWTLNWRVWSARLSALWLRRPVVRDSREPNTTGDWEARLIEAGVAKAGAPRIATLLESAYAELGTGSARALLRGATLTVAAGAGEKSGTNRNQRDVREVERLLGAFTGELEKLDEVLEVLSAYAQKMRSQPTRRNDQTLH